MAARHRGAGNGVLRAMFNRIDQEISDLPLDVKVARAAFAKCTMFGAKKASSCELVCHKNFLIADNFEALPPNLRESCFRAVARWKLGTALNSRNRKHNTFKKDECLHFYRENFGGFVGPAKVTNVDKKSNMKVSCQGRECSVSKDVVRKTSQPLEHWIDEQNTEEEPVINTPSSTEQSSADPNSESTETPNTGLKLRLANYRPGDSQPEPIEKFALPAEAPPAPHAPVGPSASTRSRTNDDTKFLVSATLPI